MNNKVVAVCACVILLAGSSGVRAQGPAVPEANQQMGDFSLSGFGDKGKKSWEVSGQSADIVSETIKLKNVQSNLYTEGEKVKVTADQGDFNRQQGDLHLRQNVVVTTESGAQLTTDSLDWDSKVRQVSTQAPVSITKEDVVITGQGASANPDLKQVSLSKDVTMNVANAVVDPSAGASALKITVSCDGPLEMDYRNNVAHFFNKVRVETPDATLESDTMDVYFTGTSAPGQGQSRIDRIVARGNVTIRRQDNVSYSEEAVYTALERRITLSGKPKLEIFSTEDLNAPFGN